MSEVQFYINIKAAGGPVLHYSQYYTLRVMVNKTAKANKKNLGFMCGVKRGHKLFNW